MTNHSTLAKVYQMKPKGARVYIFISIDTPALVQSCFSPFPPETLARMRCGQGQYYSYTARPVRRVSKSDFNGALGVRKCNMITFLFLWTRLPHTFLPFGFWELFVHALRSD